MFPASTFKVRHLTPNDPGKGGKIQFPCYESEREEPGSREEQRGDRL